MLVLFSFGYDFKPTMEDLDKLRAIVYNPDEVAKEVEKYQSYDSFTAEIEDVLKTFRGAQLRIHAEPKPEAFVSIAVSMREIKDMVGKLTAKINGFEKIENDTVYNEKCEVHIPGFGLLLIDEVIVEKDFCSESLQDRLEKGWRIIAACPQPDQRRPDYVLGRTRQQEK